MTMTRTVTQLAGMKKLQMNSQEWTVWSFWVRIIVELNLMDSGVIPFSKERCEEILRLCYNESA